MVGGCRKSDYGGGRVLGGEFHDCVSKVCGELLMEHSGP